MTNDELQTIILGIFAVTALGIGVMAIFFVGKAEGWW